MNNNQYKGGNTRTRVPNTGTRQQPRRSDVYVDLRRDGRETIFVQRSDLVSSNTGLKAKGYVDNERQVGNNKVSNNKFNSITNQAVAQVKPSRTFGNSSSVSKDVNNSSGKKTYFEPYDPRRSPVIQNNGIRFNNVQTASRTMGQFSQPQFCGYQHAGFYQQVHQNPVHPFHQIQRTNSAAAVAPNGRTIFIPLDNTKYEIKKDNHDLYDMPTGRDLFALESEGEFESNVQMVHSPRPVGLKGGLSQDSEDDSDASFDEKTSCDSDMDSRMEGSSDESEFVDNCVSDVLKTIASSVQNMTVEESENIVQRAIKEFEEGKENKVQNLNTSVPITDASTQSKHVSDANSIDQSSETFTRAEKSCSSISKSQDCMANEFNKTSMKANMNVIEADLNYEEDNTPKDDDYNTYVIEDSKDIANTNIFNYDLIDFSEQITEKNSLCKDANYESINNQADTVSEDCQFKNGTGQDTLCDKFLWSETIERRDFEPECKQRLEHQLQDTKPLDSTKSEHIDIPESKGDKKETSDMRGTIADNTWYNQRKTDVCVDNFVPRHSPLVSSDVSNITTNEIYFANPSHYSGASMRMPEIQPEVVTNNPPFCPRGYIDNNSSPVQAQNEWLLSEPSFNSANHKLSPRDYAKASNSVYIPGQVIIDGQGFFTSPTFQTVQDQSLYMSDGQTFEQVTPPAIQSMAPPYTFFIHDACPPPPSEVIFQPEDDAVPGDLIDLTTAVPYETKMYEVSSCSGNNNQECTMHQYSPSTHYISHSSTYNDNQCYSPMQLLSPVQNSSVMNDSYTHTMFGTNTTSQYIEMSGNILPDSNVDMNGPTNYQRAQDGHFFVSYDEESVYIDQQTGLSYPAIHLTDDCLLTVIFRENVCLEISVDKSIRLVHHDRKLVAAINSNGEDTCLIHPAARIYQSGTSLDAALYSNRKATMNEDYVIFGNDSQTYKFDHRVVLPVTEEPQFKDLSNDESVKFMTNDDGNYRDPDKLKQQAFETLAHAHFWKHGECGSTVIINGIKAVQSDRGDVSVYYGPIKFIRMNPSRSIIRLKSQLFEADIESNWNVKLTRGHLALNVSHLGLVVSNGKIKACIDKEDKLQSFSLPDHRVLMLGQALPQHRPGVPLWSRRRSRGRKSEPEGDHVAYSKKIEEPN